MRRGVGKRWISVAEFVLLLVPVSSAVEGNRMSRVAVLLVHTADWGLPVAHIPGAWGLDFERCSTASMEINTVWAGVELAAESAGPCCKSWSHPVTCQKGWSCAVAAKRAGLEPWPTVRCQRGAGASAQHKAPLH